MIKAITIIMTFIIHLVFSAGPDLVIEINRHGAREPLNDKDDINHQWTSYGQLTDYGQRAAYILGRAYRQDYAQLLLPLDPTKIYVRSTSVPRTAATAKSILSGIYNGSLFGKTYPQGLDVPPYNQTEVDSIYTRLATHTLNTSKTEPDIIINSVNPTDDVVLRSMDVGCPNSNLFTSQNRASAKAASIYNIYMPDIVQYLNSHKIPVNNIPDLLTFGDIAIANYYNNIAIPTGLNPTSQLFIDAKFGYEWGMTHSYTGQTLQKQIGPIYLFENILSTINSSITGESPLKFVLYSTHDNTLLSVLAAFGVVDEDCLLDNYVAQTAGISTPFPDCNFPKYASNLKFELYNGTTPIVKFYYNGKMIQVCGDSNGCSLADFTALTKQVTNNYTTKDFDSICGRGNPGPNDASHGANHTLTMTQTAKAGSILLLKLSVVLFGFMVVLCY